MAGMFDFFNTTTPATTTGQSGGTFDWLNDPNQAAAAFSGMAKAIDPRGETLGGQLGAGINSIATSKILSDKAKQDTAERKQLMGALGLTPPGVPGPTRMEVGKDGQLTITGTPSQGNKFDFPSVFGPGGASNFP